MHIGSFIAVIFYFRKDILNFFENRILFFKILISSLPIMIVGYLVVESNFIEKIRNIKVIAWTTILFGILLYISDKFELNKNIKKNLNFKSIFFIGLLQILSLVPGVSRSGIAITAARLLKFKRGTLQNIISIINSNFRCCINFRFKKYNLSGNFNFAQLNLFSIIISFYFHYNNKIF